MRAHIQKFHSSEYINALANGDICLAVGYSGDVLQARDRASEANNGVNVAYSIPKEGALMWLDSFAIPADAPHPDAAHAFINFMLKPEIAARNSNYVYYANGNKGSQEVPERGRDRRPGDLSGRAQRSPSSTRRRRTIRRSQREVTRIWTEVKTGQ